MLNPATIVDAFVAALKTITPLVTLCANDPTRIFAKHYLYGVEHSLKEEVYKLNPPAVLCVWEGTVGGNFNGYDIWKHKVCTYMRTPNQANVVAPVSYEYMWWLIANNDVNGSGQNMREINLLPYLDICDTPTVTHMVDELGMDYYKSDWVFPEIGDQ